MSGHVRASLGLWQGRGPLVWLLLVGFSMRSVPLGAQPVAADAPPLPAGLASVWRVEGRRLGASASTWSLAAYSTDGALVGVSDETGTRVYRASDGRVERTLAAPSSTGQHAFALAISPAGDVALGRVGGVAVHFAADRTTATTYHCRGVCGPVAALAFAPGGRWLAYQAARGALDAAPGAVGVIDTTTRTLAAELEAAATRSGVSFVEQGRVLLAASVTRVDASGMFGLRGWSSDDGWRRVRDVPGAPVPAGSVGPFAFTERFAAYSRDGQLELRELASGALVWAAPLAPPALDAAEDAGAMRVEHVAIGEGGRFVVSYESPASGKGMGALVFRSMTDGGPLAFYDVAGVSALAVAPDGRTFLYSASAGRAYTVLARVPL